MNEENGLTEATSTVLRLLGRKATGLSGADIERLIREARQQARRARRSLAYSDLERLLSASKPMKPEGLRWRMALHEAGHAVARLALRLGTITLITIDGPNGGMVQSEASSFNAETEEWLDSVLVAKLAGRAAEEHFLNSWVAGSGGTPDSDLGSATVLALKMEVAFGFGSEMPLLYRDAEQHSSLLIRPDVARRVNERLERAYSRAKGLIQSHEAAVEALARKIIATDTLEGTQLSSALELIGV